MLRYSLAFNEKLPRKDSNLDKEIQNLSCYRYTTRHRAELDLSAGRLAAQVGTLERAAFI